jgi:hypothetical protein
MSLEVDVGNVRQHFNMLTKLLKLSVVAFQLRLVLDITDVSQTKSVAHLHMLDRLTV